MSEKNDNLYIDNIKNGVKVFEGTHKLVDPKCLHSHLETLIKNKELGQEVLEELSKLLGFENAESFGKALSQPDLSPDFLDEVRKKLNTQLVVDYLQTFPDLWKPLNNFFTPLDSFLNTCGKHICVFDDSIASAFASSVHKIFPKIAEGSCKQFSKAAGPVSVLVGSVVVIVKVASTSDESQRKKVAARGAWELGLSTIGGAFGSFIPIPVVGTMIGTWGGSKIGNFIATSLGC